MTTRAPSLPTSVKIAAYTYEVGFGLTADEGSIHHEGQTITIHPDRGKDATADTLLHECMHGLFIQTGLRGGEVVSEKTEERIIQAITPMLLLMLRDNPKLVEFLTA